MSSDVVRKLLERKDATISRTRVTTTRVTSSPGHTTTTIAASSTVTLSDRPVLVLHFGSRYTRAGFAGEDVPRLMLKTCVTEEADGSEKWLFDVTNSIERKALLYKFFQKLYNKQLLVKSPEHRVLLCKDYTSQDPFFEDAVHVLQDNYSVPEVMVSYSHELALYALGTDSALFVDCGDRTTHCIAVSKTYPIVKTLAFADKGASTVRRRLREMIEDGDALSEDDVEDIQVRACFACHPPEGVTSSDAPYDIGTRVLTVPGSARVCAADTLFTRDDDGASVQELVAHALNNAPIDDRKDLAQRIVLLGGTSHMRGFGYRLLQELQHEAQGEGEEGTTYGYLECPFPSNVIVWIGAAIASALPNFHHQHTD
ncbi:hypothetical protein PTSG_01019 [Salpingoeca rosetta]|uniref:Actin n=1 Tax=Salpingoeca rosetta (strain ATCC 50818 / BSB-021) TaxID=946362 RepID=F2TY58_SALR5|nr:uncharacterized protein PTSG_01019 [Salpingoeca rosetta]EGD76317.1 hypothetical protein PTSG_01019 [Salpingoeca rosetta]|eukprot:XP_004998492.1 hypothetical protein PTSG_01019 [Salpingoeca rosetta]